MTVMTETHTKFDIYVFITKKTKNKKTQSNATAIAHLFDHDIVQQRCSPNCHFIKLTYGEHLHDSIHFTKREGIDL